MIFGNGFIAKELSKRKLDSGWIFNLACYASPARQRENPDRVIEANTSLVHWILEKARREDAIVLQSSTVDVYQDLDTPYCRGKKIAEDLFTLYRDIFGVKIRIVRLGNVFGPTMPNDGRVIPMFISKALENKPIHVFGNAIRSFLYIDDAIDGLISVMQGNDEIVDLCHPEQIRMLDLARLIVEMTNSKSKIIHVDAPFVDQIPRGCYSPNFDLRQGLSEIIRRFYEKDVVYAGDKRMATGNHRTNLSSAEALCTQDWSRVLRDRGSQVSGLAGCLREDADSRTG